LRYCIKLPKWYGTTFGTTHRRYLEYQQTEKIETEVIDVDRIRMISKVAFWWVIRAIQSDINICYSFSPSLQFPTK
jgi:hypothetical protein